MWNFDLLVDFYIVNATRSRLRLVTAPSVGASRYYVADVLRMSRRGVIVTDVWAPPREETGGGTLARHTQGGILVRGNAVALYVAKSLNKWWTIKNTKTSFGFFGLKNRHLNDVPR